MGITRRDFIRTTGAAVVAAKASKTIGAPVEKRPNLLWIMTDQQPVNTIRAYGNPIVETPNIDRIANEGVRFDRFHIAAFPCTPSRACFLTGRHAHNNGAVRNDVPLPADVPALGDILKAAGYRTAHIGKWHLSGNMYRNLPSAKPFEGRWYFERISNPEKYEFERVEGGTGEDSPQHGFDRWVGGWTHYRDYLRTVGFEDLVETSPVGCHNDAPSGGDDSHAVSRLPEEHHMEAFFANEAVGFLEDQREQEDPFAMVLSFYGPHLPVAPPKPWDDKYPLDKIPLPQNHKDDLTGKPSPQRLNEHCYVLPTWSEDQYRDYIRRYWGYCSYIDRQIGRVLDALDESGESDNTIVLFTSDHGDMVGAHGFIYKLTYCGYDELLRVPFLLRYPGRLRAGSSCGALTSSVDALPTLMELMGVPRPEGIDGRSFLPVLDGASQEHRETLFCNSSDYNLTATGERWKYVLNWNPRDLDELYDLETDPGEMCNLSSDEKHQEVVQGMQGHIAKWLEETKHPYASTVLEAMETPKN
jgi:arylsulfatase A-like enzyme